MRPRRRSRRRKTCCSASSIRAQVVEPGQGVYAATKAGVVQMVRALAAELGALGVRANCIAPGVVETPLTAPIKQHPGWYQAYADKGMLRRWAQADEMVGAVIYLASDAGSYVTLTDAMTTWDLGRGRGGGRAVSRRQSAVARSASGQASPAAAASSGCCRPRSSSTTSRGHGCSSARSRWRPAWATTSTSRTRWCSA